MIYFFLLIIYNLVVCGFLVGLFWEVLHNSYVKGGLALSALIGPGRGLLIALPFLVSSIRL